MPNSIRVDVDVGGQPVNVRIQPTPLVKVYIKDKSVAMRVEPAQQVLAKVEPVNVVIPITGLSGGNPAALKLVCGEIPIGAIDGYNTIFSTASAYLANQLVVFLNGLHQQRITDYTETGSRTFSFLNAPLPGDSLSINYTMP